ncbi:hypothetical protein MED01_002406 [Micromonospora sp. MED01]|uniref:hypothetical protein n=1 Tax=Micromonospora alfalfae TaxID=2911212 RepID=UPI001EE8FD74|nr:hypothetical protein [Micromonospora alfalfae]MCG5464241.1 hypothetical protein [Micromonospora alfalfae]
MATLVSDPIRFIADQWENHCGYPSAVLSGIVPDGRHLDNGGYHCSVEDLKRFGNQRDYSNIRPDDKDRNVRYGAAIDMSLSPSDMKRSHDRMRKVWVDTTDPRRKYLNAFNTWDGSGDAVRLDFYAGTAGYASPDHKWHDHQEVRRRYVLDMTAAEAIVSALKGETKQQYLNSADPIKTPTVEDDMTPEEHNWLATVHKNLTMLDGRNPIGQIYTRMSTGEDATDAKYVAETPTLKSLGKQLTALQTALTALAGRDFTDEPAIVQGVLASLTPEKIAAAIPPTMAKQVADELARRLVAE